MQHRVHSVVGWVIYAWGRTERFAGNGVQDVAPVLIHGRRGPLHLHGEAPAQHLEWERALPVHLFQVPFARALRFAALLFLVQAVQKKLGSNAPFVSMSSRATACGDVQEHLSAIGPVLIFERDPLFEATPDSSEWSRVRVQDEENSDAEPHRLEERRLARVEGEVLPQAVLVVRVGAHPERRVLVQAPNLDVRGDAGDELLQSLAPPVRHEPHWRLRGLCDKLYIGAPARLCGRLDDEMDDIVQVDPFSVEQMRVRRVGRLPPFCLAAAPYVRYQRVQLSQLYAPLLSGIDHATIAQAEVAESNVQVHLLLSSMLRLG
mmetsp:Transcript_67363/g.186711  ORF Transcript_67363/g.186711 Transcript_67363/m.186711 type:complete len:319 (+) Transcript_67363:1318-2274(+)